MIVDAITPDVLATAKSKNIRIIENNREGARYEWKDKE